MYNTNITYRILYKNVQSSFTYISRLSVLEANSMFYIYVHHYLPNTSTRAHHLYNARTLQIIHITLQPYSRQNIDATGHRLHTSDSTTHNTHSLTRNITMPRGGGGWFYPQCASIHIHTRLVLKQNIHPSYREINMWPCRRRQAGPHTSRNVTVLLHVNEHWSTIYRTSTRLLLSSYVLHAVNTTKLITSFHILHESHSDHI
jgi:hypothetical protein